MSKLLENSFGPSYSLLIYISKDKEVRNALKHDYPKFAAVNTNPLFSRNNELRIATKYTIIYPMVYVRSSKPFEVTDIISKGYIQ